MRKHAIGFEGEDPVVTPNLDSFAKESVILTHATSTSPVCSPYRAMLFTGKYPHGNGVLVNVNSLSSPRGNFLKDGERCFSDVLKDEGYSQGYIGKLHLHAPDPNPPYDYGQGPLAGGVVWDAWTPPGPGRHGFDFWYSYGTANNHLAPHYWTGDGDAKSSRVDIDEWSVKHETDVAIRYIENEDGSYRDEAKPFSLFVSHNPPHSPYDKVPPEYLEYYDDRTNEELLNRSNVRFEGRGKEAREHAKNYFAAVTGIDEQFARILETLERRGLKDNTIVVFTSDHGEMMGSHGLMEKSVWYGESLRVPFIVRWPACLKPRKDDLLIGSADIYPTLLGLMGFAESIPAACEGSNYAETIATGSGPRPESAFYLCMPSRPEPPIDAVDRRGVFTHAYTFAVEYGPQARPLLYLFDDREDPYQLRNIASDRPEVVRRMKAEFHAWLRRTNDPWLASKRDLFDSEVE